MNIKTRVRQAVRDGIMAISGLGIDAANAVVRKSTSAADLEAPALVVCGTRGARLRSAAGMRERTINSLVSLYFRIDQQDPTPVPSQSDQEEIIEKIEAAWDVPRTMPAALTAAVPEAQECRVVSADTFLPAELRYQVNVHRLVIAIDVCQVAGVV